MNTHTLPLARLTADSIEGRRAQREAQKLALDSFRQLMLSAASLASLAANLDVDSHWQAQARAVADICGIRLSRFVCGVEPGEFRDISADMMEIARSIDTVFAAIGAHVQEYASPKIDLAYFEEPAQHALQGYATHEIERVAEDLEEEYGR